MDLWEKVIPGFKYSKETPFFEMVVPTVDTVRYGYLLEKLLAVKQSVLYTGNTGVGKVCQRSLASLQFISNFFSRSFAQAGVYGMCRTASALESVGSIECPVPNRLVGLGAS